MKLLFLMFSRMKQYYQKSRLIFILFVIGAMVNAIMLAYCYGNLLDIIFYRQTENYVHRKYSLNPGEECTQEKIDILAESDLIEQVVARVKIPDEQIPSDLTNPNFLIPYYDGLPLDSIQGTYAFDNAYQIAVPRGHHGSIGDTVTLFGREFEIIGIIEQLLDCRCYVIPAEAFRQMNLVDELYRIYVVSKDMPELEDSQNTTPQLLAQLFPETVNDSTRYNPPTLDYIFKLEMTFSQLPRILFTYVLSSLAFIFMLRYLTDSLMGETVISRIVGATQSDLAFSIFWETALLTTFASVLGLLAHKLLYLPLFQKLNIHEGITYGLTDYINITIAIFLTSLLVVLPIVTKYLRLSPMAARRMRG